MVGYYAAVVRRAVRDTWGFVRGEGLLVGAVVTVLSIVFESVSERHVHVGNLVVAALVAVGAVTLLALAVNATLAPVRLAREQVTDHADEIEELHREHSEHVTGLDYGHGLRVNELERELVEARDRVVVLEEEARRPDRVALLREACKDGKGVLTRLVVLSTEDRRFEAACDWVRETWAMLRDHFPQHSQEFYGPDSEATSWMFPVSCRAEIDSMNGYVETYVEAKLALLHGWLNRYDVSG